MALTAHGLRINTTDREILDRAVGQNVKLECKFTPAPEDAGNLEIEWSKSVRHPTEKFEILFYTAGYIYDCNYAPLKRRVYFREEDPGKGDASIELLLLTCSDTAFYYCQVKKAPGIKSIKTGLRVLEPPSKPRCFHVEGAGKVGETQVLKCGSEEDAAPTWYSWTRKPPGKLLPTSAAVDKTAGTLTVRDASESNAGTYKCTATNRVGQEDCFLELNLPGRLSVEVIAAAAASGPGAVGIIAFVICWIARRRRISEPETSNEVVRDLSPPGRRTELGVQDSYSSAPFSLNHSPSSGTFLPHESEDITARR